MQQRDMYKQLSAERELKIQQLGGTTRSAEMVKSELENREEEKKALERDNEMYVDRGLVLGGSAGFCTHRHGSSRLWLKPARVA